MKIKKSLSLLCLLIPLMLFSCDYLKLSGTEDTDQDGSILSSTIGENYLLPPATITYTVSKNFSDYVIRLSWNAVSFAKKYNVYLDDKKVAQVTESYYNYSFTLPKNVNEKNLEFSVSVFSSADQESAKFPSVVVTVARQQQYQGVVTQANASKGTENGILVQWVTVPGAAYYKVERVEFDSNRTGEPSASDFTVVQEKLFPVNPNAAMIKFVDSNVPKKANLYNYYITPYSQDGVEGVRSTLAKKNVALEGYTRAVPEDFKVSCGLLDDNDKVIGSVTDKKSVIQVTWKIKSRLTDKNGILENPAEDPLRYDTKQNPSSVVLEAAYTPTDEYFKSLEYMFVEGDKELYALKNIEGETYKEDGLPSGLEKRSQAGMNLWSIEEDGYRTYYYRTVVEDIDFSKTEVKNDNYETSWTQKFYFRIKLRYNEHNSDLAYSTPYSLPFGGWAIDPAADKIPNGVVTASVGEPTAEGDPTISLSWESAGDGLKYFIYKKESDGLVYKCIDTNGTDELTMVDLDAKKGVKYLYAVAVSSSDYVHHGVLSADSELYLVK